MSLGLSLKRSCCVIYAMGPAALIVGAMLSGAPASSPPVDLGPTWFAVRIAWNGGTVFTPVNAVSGAFAGQPALRLKETVSGLNDS